TTYKFKTDILVGADGLEEEGWTTIVVNGNEKNGCRVTVYTKAIPGNGGLSSIPLATIKKLRYT
ncbi:MAG: hypothetical protein PHU12_04590, partial [Candidatus Aenigmarchaeota archaeon]|nr:hypothetical protein [Candidatus Aenigmarchaeota archaeon]